MADFFVPGTTYLRDNPYKAPELLEVFHCVAVANNPRDGKPRAFGFAKGLTEPVEGWYSTAMTPEVWAVGWVEGTDALAAPDTAAADVATEAFVDVADAERYALRDEYVNSDDAEDEQAARVVEHVDYDEAEAVREIQEEMALEAAGVESWDQL